MVGESDRVEPSCRCGVDDGLRIVRAVGKDGVQVEVDGHLSA